MLLADQKLKVCEIAEAIGISDGFEASILNEHFGMRKLLERRDMRFSTIDPKRHHVTTSREYVELSNHNSLHNRGLNMDFPQLHNSGISLGK